jgi:hypothetical protein
MAVIGAQVYILFGSSMDAAVTNVGTLGYEQTNTFIAATTASQSQGCFMSCSTSLNRNYTLSHTVAC